jgi:hypothetical protein
MSDYEQLLAANAPGEIIADVLEEEGRYELAELYRRPRLPATSHTTRAAQSRMLPSGLPELLFGITVVETERPAPKRKRTKRGAGKVKIGKHTFKVANWSTW